MKANRQHTCNTSLTHIAVHQIATIWSVVLVTSEIPVMFCDNWSVIHHALKWHLTSQSCTENKQSFFFYSAWQLHINCLLFCTKIICSDWCLLPSTFKLCWFIFSPRKTFTMKHRIHFCTSLIFFSLIDFLLNFIKHLFMLLSACLTDLHSNVVFPPRKLAFMHVVWNHYLVKTLFQGFWRSRSL